MEKGVFTEETRHVVRLLVKAGCSQNFVNEVITTVLDSAGITAVGKISRTSVMRILREGYYAAQIQLGHEMENTRTMTFSADGTSHQGIEYNSQHVHLMAESYESGDAGIKKWTTCTFGISTPKDGSSKEAIAEWE